MLHVGKIETTLMRRSSRDNLGIFVMLLCLLALVIPADRMGMPQKWHAAILGTVAPFGVAILLYRLRWSKWSFWAALIISLVIHVAAMYVFFQYVLSNVRTFGWLWWTPVAFVETFILIVAIKRVEEKLTGKREIVTLS